MKLDRPGRVTAWIAIFAVLLAALAPTVARAVASPQQVTPWGDLCTAGRQQAAHDEAPPFGPNRHEGMVFKHCPLCLNHVGHFALPSATPGVLQVVDTSAVRFRVPALPASPRFIRVAAQPRAPPAVS